MGFAREMLLRGSRSQWLADQLTRRSFTQKAVQRFMPGEKLEDALDATESLRFKNISTILTLLGENVTEAEAADALTQYYLDVLDRATELEFDSDISLKPTQFGIDLNFEQTVGRYETLVKRAEELERMVAVDMEDSSYVDRTIELYRRLRGAHQNVTLCLQSYLYRTTSDLITLLPEAPSIRLVKGAYNEPRTIAYRHKKDVDVNFLRLTDTLLDEVKRETGVSVIFGTHDPHMVTEVNRRAAERGLPKDSYEFQMLYGIQRELQTQLAAGGYRMRVLISYGDSWFPWYMRRLAERPANIVFLLRNLFAA
jgi:proline dehydrogenase